MLSYPHHRQAFAAIGLASALLASCGGGGGGSSPSTPPVAAPPPNPTPVSQTNVIYGSGLTDSGAINLLLDIYQPGGACTEPRPLVVGIHGGSFIGGSKSSSSWIEIASDLNERGYVVISIDYRLVGDEPDVSAEFEPLLDDFLDEAARQQVDAAGLLQINAAAAAVEDTVTALRWAQTNSATRCIDPDRIAMIGASAGAVTVLNTTYLLDPYGIDFPQPGVVVDLWGQIFLRGEIEANEAPMMIIHGTNDQTVVYGQARLIQNEADAVGLPYSFYTVQDGGHGFSIMNRDRVQLDGMTLYDLMYDFIDDHLLGGTPTYEVRTVVPTP